MAEKSGFFNALFVDNEYDRTYDANDYTENLAVVISNGVLLSEADDLKVTASGLVVKVAPGRGWINGHWYYNDQQFSFPAITAPVGGSRYDRVMLRYDNRVSARKVSLVYVQGTAGSSPVKPAPTRNENVYDLVLADIFIQAQGTNVAVTDTRASSSLCGWVYSTAGDNTFFTNLTNEFTDWFEEKQTEVDGWMEGESSEFEQWFDEKKDTLAGVTLFKRYSWSGTISGQSVAFQISQYDPDTCFLEVYVNGIYRTDYTRANNVITFTGSVTSGAAVIVNCYKSLDGEGIMSVADEITQLQTQMAAVIGTNKFVYACTGLNDNVALSEIIQAWEARSYTVGSLSSAAEAFLSAIGGNTYLASLDHDCGQIEIEVVGACGVQTPATDDSHIDVMHWFDFGQITEGNKVILDFAKAGVIEVPAAAGRTMNQIFSNSLGPSLGTVCLKNAYVKATETGTDPLFNAEIWMTRFNAGSFPGGVKNVFENCTFEVSTSGTAVVGTSGTFINCNSKVSSQGQALCYDAGKGCLVRVIGGTHIAMTTHNTAKVAVFNCGKSDAAIIATNVNCPTVGNKQLQFAICNSGAVVVNGITSQLVTAGTNVTVTGLVNMSINS